MLSLQVPLQLFKTVQTTLNKFVWGDMKPRLPLSLLQLNPTEGGLGLPKLLTYYISAILESVIRLHAPKNTFQWADMEQDKILPTPLTSILWSPKAHRPITNVLYPTFALTLKVWDTLRSN
ncbi:nuclear receptor coactivator 7-like [Pelobates cultripes]|nr:nuclear receptor coactivator 7-like [Pelobates cultripes]